MDNESSASYETRLDIGMTCEGCAAAVKRLLTKINGETYSSYLMRIF